MRRPERKPAVQHWHEFPHIAFDLDGTLLDTNLAQVWAWQDAIEEAGLFFPHLTLFIQMGMPAQQLIEKFGYALRDRATAAQVAERASGLYAENYARLVSPFEGVVKLLKTLKRLGRELHAISSAASDVEAAATIERFGLTPYFSTVLTTSSSPAPFSALKEKIGARARLVSLGDSPYDLRASQSAGVPFVFVGQGGFPREWFHHAAARFFNIRELLSSLPQPRPNARRRR